MNEDTFRRHGVWETLGAVGEEMASVDRLGDIEASRRLDEMRQVVAYIASLEELTNVALVSPHTVDRLQDSLVQVQSYLQTYTQDPVNYSSYLGTALEYLNSVRDCVSLFPTAQGSPAARAAFTRSMNEYRNQMDSSREALASRLREVLDAAEEREEALAAQVDSLASQLATAAEAVGVLEVRVSTGESRLDKALTTNNEAFNSSQSDRSTKFSAWLDEQESDFSKLATPHLKSISTAADTAQEGMEQVEALRTSTVEIASLAAGDILSDKYGAYARSERLASYIAYGVGAFAALGGIVIVLFAFGSIQAVDNWHAVVLKFGLTAVAGGIATVAFRFGGQATRRSTSFKRQELELRALQPFLKGVVGADLAKTAFLERAFGHAWVDPASKPEPDTNQALLALLANMVQNASKSGAASGS